jgi:hypothetical protein
MGRKKKSLEELRAALVKAVRACSAEDVAHAADEIISSGFNLDFKVPLAVSTALGIAAFKLDARSCRILLDKGADPEYEAPLNGVVAAWMSAGYGARANPHMRGEAVETLAEFIRAGITENEFLPLLEGNPGIVADASEFMASMDLERNLEIFFQAAPKNRKKKSNKIF